VLASTAGEVDHGPGIDVVFLSSPSSPPIQAAQHAIALG
jgi:hypothetical protein